ncbi:MAG: ribosome maturation factor RimM [Candidatus Eremiobacteraeota bacterium]|nr:ribosome maturation factor RimM [Candidatus Eremiobacteraeota bacterium]
MGRIAGLFGVRGELKCDPTSAGRSVFVKGAQLNLTDASGATRAVHIQAVREHKGRLLLRLAGVDDASAAQALVGSTFDADASNIELDENEYLDRDLIGCALYEASGRTLGVVDAVDHFPSGDMLVVGGKLVPMIHEFIKSVDVARKRIAVELPAGLLDDAEAVEG